MIKEIEQLTIDDLAEIWGKIGGTPHLFEFGKDNLMELLTTGYCEDHGLMLDYYTMAAIVDTLRQRGFPAPTDDTRQHPPPLIQHP